MVSKFSIKHSGGPMRFRSMYYNYASSIITVIYTIRRLGVCNLVEINSAGKRQLAIYYVTLPILIVICGARTALNHTHAWARRGLSCPSKQIFEYPPPN